MPKVNKAQNQMWQTKFLQMWSFFIILTSLHSSSLSFPLLFYVISTAILKFPPQISGIPTLIPRTRIPIPFLVFPSSFSAFPSFHSHIPILVFTESLLSCNLVRIYLRKLVVLNQNRILPFLITA